jgi:acetylornithine deacetylase/succinyl-diaminopimelate desuccinylase-like protein
MDDKGGIVAGIYALKILKNLDFKDYAQITFLLDASEETGSDVATDLIKKTAKAHDVTLNLEPGRPADGLVVWRKGSATALVEVKGKAAHAASRRSWDATRRWKRRTRFCNWANSATKRRKPRSTSPCSRPVTAPT